MVDEAEQGRNPSILRAKIIIRFLVDRNVEVSTKFCVSFVFIRAYIFH